MTDTLQTYRFIFLRHGESVGNAENRFQGQSDFPLTDTGREQARALAARWLRAGQSFDQCLASPLARARETAEIVTGTLGVPLELDPVWMEWENGKLAGLTHEEGDRLFPRPAFIHPYQPIGRTGESRWELYLRAGRGVQALLERPPARYLIVSHGAILNMTMYAMLGISPQANFNGPHFRFQNTAFSTLTYFPHEHRWRLEGVNDHAHWDFPDEDDR